MADNELFIQSGVGTAITSNNNTQTISVDIIPEALCASADNDNPLIISYGTEDPTANTPGKVYIKYNN